MDAEIAANPVPGAVLEIDARVPQRRAGENIQLRAGRAFGKLGPRQCDMALEHPGEPVPHFVARFTQRDRSGHIGGAVQILRAGIDQEQGAGLQFPVGLRRDAVMDDGPVGPGPGYGRETQPLDQLVFASKGFQLTGRAHFRRAGGEGLAIQPGEKPCQCRAVPDVGPPGPVQFRRVLARLRQRAGVGAAANIGAGRFQRLENRFRGAGRVHPNRGVFRAECHEGRYEVVVVRNVYSLFQARRRSGEDFLPVDEQREVATVTQDAKAQRQRRIRNVATPDIGKPGNGIRRRENDRVFTLLFHLLGDFAAFFG